MIFSGSFALRRRIGSKRIFVGFTEKFCDGFLTSDKGGLRVALVYQDRPNLRRLWCFDHEKN
jgi:hypothetical protein